LFNRVSTEASTLGPLKKTQGLISVSTVVL
jgi:hypothetical protein